MKKIIPCLFLWFIILVSACQKENSIALSDVYASEPVFTFTANNGLYDINAGVANFYLFSDYELDSMSIYSFVGTFAKLPDCSYNCLESLTIKIRDFQSVETGSAVVITSSVTVGDYLYLESQDNIGFSNVFIEYTDENGTVFRSDLEDQLSANTFQILSVSDYEINENGQPTKKLEIAFNCILRNQANGVTISFENALATIAVAYPN